MTTKDEALKSKRIAEAKEVRAIRQRMNGARFSKFMSSKIGWDKGDPVEEQDEDYAERIARLEKKLALEQASEDFGEDYGTPQCG